MSDYKVFRAAKGGYIINTTVPNYYFWLFKYQALVTPDHMGPIPVYIVSYLDFTHKIAFVINWLLVL